MRNGMNIQGGRMRGCPTRRNDGAGAVGSRLATAFRIFVILALIGALANGYIYLNQKIAETSRAIRSTEREIYNTEREIANMESRREQLSEWTYIRTSIARFGLPLRQAEPGQVRHLVMTTRDTPAPARTADARPIRREH